MSRIDIKPRIVEDLEKYELYRDKKKTTYTVGSIKKDRFIMASEKNVDDIIGVYKLFDGEHTIDDIVKIYKDNHKEIDVLKLFNIAEQAGLIENTNKKEVILNVKIFPLIFKAIIFLAISSNYSTHPHN